MAGLRGWRYVGCAHTGLRSLLADERNPADHDMNNIARCQENVILASLNSSDFQLLQPGLRDVALKIESVLDEPDAPIEYVYFPTHGMVSKVTTMSQGQSVETGIVGREGIVGAEVIASANADQLMMVQAAGGACRIPSNIFVSAYEQSKNLRLLVNQHLTGMWSMARQCAACNAVHKLEGRLARWLLQSRDLLGTDDLPLKQEFLALMLGVQRTSVTLAERHLQEEELIRIGRGRVTILNVDALQQRSCECYARMKH